MASSGRQFGEGPLSRVSALLYTLIVVELLVLLASLPGLVPLALLDADASNIPVVALCALPFGPAVSAALYAIGRRSTDITDIAPARAFWRGYRMNAGGVLKLWIPWLVWMTIIGVNLAGFSAARVPSWWAVVLVLIALASSVWMANALVITSLFAFRARDIARLAVYFLFRTPVVALGTAALLALAIVVTAYVSVFAALALATVLAMALLSVGRRMTDQVRDRFTA
ncbi:MAG: DUF624 domain-containing protein [Micromonosporaceae bacterium]|nr:DUF624 domain-containing protein [Micromonosporaceae bacterium]